MGNILIKYPKTSEKSDTVLEKPKPAQGQREKQSPGRAEKVGPGFPAESSGHDAQQRGNGAHNALWPLSADGDQQNASPQIDKKQLQAELNRSGNASKESVETRLRQISQNLNDFLNSGSEENRQAPPRNGHTAPADPLKAPLFSLAAETAYKRNGHVPAENKNGSRKSGTGSPFMHARKSENKITAPPANGNRKRPAAARTQNGNTVLPFFNKKTPAAKGKKVVDHSPAKSVKKNGGPATGPVKKTGTIEKIEQIAKEIRQSAPASAVLKNGKKVPVKKVSVMPGRQSFTQKLTSVGSRPVVKTPGKLPKAPMKQDKGSETELLQKQTKTPPSPTPAARQKPAVQVSLAQKYAGMPENLLNVATTSEYFLIEGVGEKASTATAAAPPKPATARQSMPKSAPPAKKNTPPKKVEKNGSIAKNGLSSKIQGKPAQAKTPRKQAKKTNEAAIAKAAAKTKKKAAKTTADTTDAPLPIKRDAHYAIGIYIEGANLYMACFCKSNGSLYLVESHTMTLSSRLDSQHPGEAFTLDSLDINIQEGTPIKSESPLQNLDAYLTELDQENDDSAELKYYLSKYVKKKFNLAISIAEPQVHYSHSGADENLEAREPKKRIIDELSQIQPDAKQLKPEDINLIQLADKRLMAIIRNFDYDVINLFKGIKLNLFKRLSFIESAEISLVNLINLNYDLAKTDTSIIVNISPEISRLIFMQGKEIFYISYITGTELAPEEMCQTIYSKMLLEQDTLNLPKVNQVILTGDSSKIKLKEFLSPKLPRGTNLEYFQFRQLDIRGAAPEFTENAIACGAALRVLEKQNESLYDIDLTPHEIKAAQKFQMGILGWIFIILIPLFAFIATIKYGQQSRELSQLESKIQTIAVQADQYQQTELKLNVFRRTLGELTAAETFLDSMTVKTNTWGQFMQKLAVTSKRVGSIWVTGFDQTGHKVILLRGYATKRENVLRFVELLGNATITRIDTEEIRERKIYTFSLETSMAELNEAGDAEN